MGALTSCADGGGICGGNSKPDPPTPTHNAPSPPISIEKQRLLDNTYIAPQQEGQTLHNTNPSSSSSTSSIDTIEQEKISKKRKKNFSIYKMPTKKIAIPPVISNHILLNDKFNRIRIKMENNAKNQYNDLSNVIFSGDFWLIQGSDAITLEEYRDLFNIVIWRIPIIPAYSHFKDDKSFYNKIFNQKPSIDITGIWSVLSKENFIKLFDKRLLDNIDIINDLQHNYLSDDDDDKENNRDLITKLQKIEIVKKHNEIIIIGQRNCVRKLIHIIRKKEVNHSSILGYYKLPDQKPWEIKEDDPNAPDPAKITAYYCIVENVPKDCDQQVLMEFLMDYDRWTYVTVTKNENGDDDDDGDGDNDDDNDDDSDSDSDNDSDSDSSDDNDQNDNKLDYQFAKIEFDTNKALQLFIDDIKSDDGLYVMKNKLILKKQDKETRNRKRRRLYASHMIV